MKEKKGEYLTGQPAFVLHVICPHCKVEKEVIFTSMKDQPLKNDLGNCTSHRGVTAIYLSIGEITASGTSMEIDMQDDSLRLLHSIYTLSGVYKDKFKIPLPDEEWRMFLAKGALDIVNYHLSSGKPSDDFIVPHLMDRANLTKLIPIFESLVNEQQELITDKQFYNLAMNQRLKDGNRLN